MKKSQRAKRPKLVTNDAAVASPPPVKTTVLQHITANLRGDLVRNDKMEGRDFIVVPMVMMVEGVHEGSQGPLYYPADELGKTPQVWNHKPVVVYHPTINGEGVSACDPDIITSHKIGVIMNTKFDDLGRLTAEAWIEEKRADAVDKRIMKAIRNKKVMELSTGLFTDNEETVGEFNGEKYELIARNYRPDHLAVLPDQTGACSVKDGAGFIRNQASRMIVMNAKVDNATNAKLEQASKVIFATLNSLGLLEASHETVRSLLSSALIKAYPAKSGKDSCCYGPWIEAVYDDFFIYCQDGKLFKLGYSATDTAVKLEGEPSEVVRVTEYRTVSGAFVGNDASHNHNPNPTMDKTQKVNALIGNKASGFTEADRPFLTALDDARLDAFVANAATKAPAAAAPAAPAAEPAKPAVNAEPAKPAAPALNAEDQAALDYGKRQLTANKGRLVKVILANKQNKFTEAALNAKGIEELELLAELAGSKPADYSGLGEVAEPVANAANEEEPLGLPSTAPAVK
jgi:hypothetical protein